VTQELSTRSIDELLSPTGDSLLQALTTRIQTKYDELNTGVEVWVAWCFSLHWTELGRRVATKLSSYPVPAAPMHTNYTNRSALKAMLKGGSLLSRRMLLNSPALQATSRIVCIPDPCGDLETRNEAST